MPGSGSCSVKLRMYSAARFRRVLFFALGERPFVETHHVALFSLEFGRRESETRGPGRLRDQGVQAAFDAVVSDQRHQRGGLLRPNEQAPLGVRAHEWRIALDRQLREPRVQHARIEPFDLLLAIGANRRLVTQRKHVVEADVRHRRLLVGGDRVEGVGVIGNLEARPRPAQVGRRDGSELPPDQILHPCLVEIADRNDGHEIRPIPVRVEALQRLGLEVPDVLHRADRCALGVARAPEQDRKLQVLHPGVRPASLPPFLDDHAAFLLDGLGIEREAVSDVREKQERLAHGFRVVGRDVKHVHRFVERGIRVHPGAQPHADRLHELDELELREVLAATECHVLDEVGQADLVVVLHHGSHIHHEPQFCALHRSLIGPDVIPQSVRQVAD